MKKQRIAWGMLAVLLVCAGAFPALGAGLGIAVVDGKTADRVHLRERPSAQSRSLGLYFTGTQAQSDGVSSDGWVRVQIGAQGGYMKAEYLHFGAEPGGVRPRQPLGTVRNAKQGSWVNLRDAPSLYATSIGKYQNGDEAVILGETDTHWYYVQIGTQNGYMLADYMAMGDAAAPGAFKAVLLGDATFVRANDQRAMDIRQLTQAFDGVVDTAMEIAQFALADLDRDGVPEVILSIKAVGGYDYGVALLRYQDGAVYGYDLVYRAFMRLKADGTFSFSSGAMDSGFGTLRFAKDGCAIVEESYSQSGAGSDVAYFVNRAPATEAAYRAALRRQEEKPDAVWYAFTEANIGAMFPQ